MYILRHITLLLTLLAVTMTARAQRIAVNTDIATDLCMAPSLGVELTMGKKSTLNLNALYGGRILGSDIRIAALQPEWKVYISGRPMYHHYVGFVGLLTSCKM